MTKERNDKLPQIASNKTEAIKKKAKQLACRKTPIDEEGEIGSPPSKKKKLQHQQQPIEYSIADDSDFVEPETEVQDDEENWDVV